MTPARICCTIPCTRIATWELDYGEPGNDPYSQSDSCDVHLAELARGFGPVVVIVPLAPPPAPTTCPTCFDCPPWCDGKAPAPTTCPTCRSTQPAAPHTGRWWRRDDGELLNQHGPCPDSWHQAATPPG